MAYNNNRKVNNYFTQNIQRNGENFLQTINTRNLQSDTIRIFRDLARGKVNLEDHGKYFLDNQLIETCIIAAQHKLNLYSISYSGVLILVTDMRTKGIEPDGTTLGVLDYHMRCAEAYSLIVEAMKLTSRTKDYSHIQVLVNNLQSYRNNI